MGLIDGTPPTEQDLYDARQLIEQREDAEVAQQAVATSEHVAAYYREDNALKVGGGQTGGSVGGRVASAKGYANVNDKMGAGLVVGSLALPKIGQQSRRHNGAGSQPRSRRV